MRAILYFFEAFGRMAASYSTNRPVVLTSPLEFVAQPIDINTSRKALLKISI